MRRGCCCEPDLAMASAGVEINRHPVKQLVRRLLEHVRRLVKIARKDASAPLLVQLVHQCDRHTGVHRSPQCRRKHTPSIVKALSFK